MKRTRKLYEILISDENLEKAIYDVNSSHRWLPHHRPNKTVIWVESDLGERVKELRSMIETGFEPSEFRKRKRWDKSACKWREITEPKLWPDQYVHHALVQVLQPVMMRGMDPFCCGSIEGRGIHYGMTAIKKWMREDRKGTKYCLEMDIRHFYDSLKADVVVQRLKGLVKDWKTLDLAERILRNGVQIGVYCSQWFANTVLQPLDRLVRQKEFAVTHYLRYMDNFTIFSSNKRKLKKLFVAVKKWLHVADLTVKGNWQIFPTSVRMPTALGYRYGASHTLLKKRNLIRLKRQLARYYKKISTLRRIPPRLASGLLSRLGQMKHCNHRKIFEMYYSPKTQRDLKQVVRINARKEKLRWNMYLEPTATPA